MALLGPVTFQNTGSKARLVNALPRAIWQPSIKTRPQCDAIGFHLYSLAEKVTPRQQIYGAAVTCGAPVFSAYTRLLSIINRLDFGSGH